MKKLIKKVDEFIKENQLINMGEKVLLMVSGGEDSALLFFVFLKLREKYNLDLSVFHLNHMLRQEAGEDEAFVKNLCEKYDVKSYIFKEDIKLFAKANKIGLEEAGRRIRYQLAKKISEENNIDKIITAHHKDDNSESVMLNIIRGSGINGLRGIDIKNEEGIIRPFLCLHKEDIKEVVKKNNILFVLDETNSDEAYKRNYVRHNFLKDMKKINSNVSDNILNLSLIAREYEDLANSLSNEIKVNQTQEGVFVFYDDLKDKHVVILKKVLINMINEMGYKKDISFDNIKDMCGLLSDIDKTVFDLNISNNLIFSRRYDKIYLKKNEVKEEKDFYYNLKKGDSLDTSKFFIKTSLASEIIKEKNVYFVDYDKLENNLVVRSKKQGDKFNPYGLNGTKKLKKYFIDLKIEKEKRANIPIIINNEEIVLVCKGNISSKYAVNKDTKNILKIEYGEKK